MRYKGKIGVAVLHEALRYTGRAGLAARLDVSVTELESYLDGKTIVPPRVFREATRVVIQAKAPKPVDEG